MKKADEKLLEDDLKPEYDFARMKGGVRGKYVKRLKSGSNLVLLSPDIFTTTVPSTTPFVLSSPWPSHT